MAHCERTLNPIYPPAKILNWNKKRLKTTRPPTHLTQDWLALDLCDIFGAVFIESEDRLNVHGAQH